MGAGLNEVQLSKELQLTAVDAVTRLASASMKCSSRKNCNHMVTALALHGNAPQ